MKVTFEVDDEVPVSEAIERMKFSYEHGFGTLKRLSQLEWDEKVFLVGVLESITGRINEMIDEEDESPIL